MAPSRREARLGENKPQSLAGPMRVLSGWSEQASEGARKGEASAQTLEWEATVSIGLWRGACLSFMAGGWIATALPRDSESMALSDAISKERYILKKVSGRGQGACERLEMASSVAELLFPGPDPAYLRCVCLGSIHIL